MGGAEWYIFEPDSSSFFITGEEWVFCNELAARSVTFFSELTSIKIVQESADNDWHSFLVCFCSCLEVDAKDLF